MRQVLGAVAELAAAGHLTDAQYRGSKVERPFNSGTIKAMIEGRTPAMDKRET